MIEHDYVRDDNNFIWQSYSPISSFKKPLLVKSANGVYIELDNGKKIIDGISSWWTVCHGHAHPYIISKVKEQIEKLPHVMYAGLYHEPAKILSHKLKEILPEEIQHFVFCESGSVAVEIAMKIALQFFYNKQDCRNTFVYFENGYSGDTIGCSIIGDDDTVTHKFIKNNINHLKLKIPKDKQDLKEFEDLIEKNYKKIAAIIIEPLVQGSGGMKFHSSEVLFEIYRITKKYDLIFIADEIATGFYRTGKFFACNYAEITPDIICLGKGITSGVIPFAAIGITQEIADEFYSDNPLYTLKHGTTYAANPLGCVAAIASIELFQKEPREKQVNNISNQLLYELTRFKNLKNVIDIRVKGAIAVLELNISYSEIMHMREKIKTKPVWLRPVKNVLYTMPPFISNENEISQIMEIMKELVEDI